jgi:hypothetical protein
MDDAMSVPEEISMSSPESARAVLYGLLPAMCRAVRGHPLADLDVKWWTGDDTEAVRMRALEALQGAWFPGADQQAGRWLEAAVDWLDAHPLAS